MGVHTIYHNDKKVVKDYREKGGMIFEGTCDYCGDTYYAKRRTATYCSKQCWTMSQKFNRIELPDGRVQLVAKGAYEKRQAEKERQAKANPKQERIPLSQLTGKAKRIALAEHNDKIDKILKRGKYAPNYKPSSLEKLEAIRRKHKE